MNEGEIRQQALMWWRRLLPWVAIGLLVLGEGIAEAVANLLGAVAGAR